MNDMTMADIREITVDEIMPHSPDLVWKTLTNPDLMGRWLMEPKGFAPVKGNKFTYQTTPAGEWDGTIECEVLEVEPGQRLVHSWVSGHETNTEYGSPLDTIVSWTLTPVDGGTRVHFTHSGFKPQNESAYSNMSQGWPKVVEQIGALTQEAN